jgi:hypothetical protein
MRQPTGTNVKLARKVPNFEVLKIEGILMAYWDPIGVKDVPGASDEYRSYAGHILTMVTERKTADEIEDYLKNVEKTRMNLARSPEYAEAAAAVIVKLVKIGEAG